MAPGSGACFESNICPVTVSPCANIPAEKQNMNIEKNSSFIGFWFRVKVIIAIMVVIQNNNMITARPESLMSHYDI